MRDRIADWAIMRATRPNITNKDIAGELGITEATLNVMITRATKEGWLVFEDPMKRLEHELAPIATSNLRAFLDEKDKQVTIEVAKGILFPAYKEHKGIQDAPQTVLAIKIEPAQGSPEGSMEVKDFSGTIVGTPRSLGES